MSHSHPLETLTHHSARAVWSIKHTKVIGVALVKQRRLVLTAQVAAIHLFHLAWDRIKSELSDTYIQCFELLGSGNTIDDICQKLDIKKNTVHVYRQRILKRLGREIRFLDDELA